MTHSTLHRFPVDDDVRAVEFEDGCYARRFACFDGAWEYYAAGEERLPPAEGHKAEEVRLRTLPLLERGVFV